MNEHFNATEILSKALKERRAKLNYSLREVAAETGISFSTIARIESGVGKPDADTTAALADWLGIPLDRVLCLEEPQNAPVIYYPHEPVTSIVEAHLRADRNLTPESAEKLSALFRTAYEQYSKFDLKKGGSNA